MKRRLWPFVLTAVLAVSVTAAVHADADERAMRTEAVSLARRQALMWEAAVKNDWEALYDLVVPRMRGKVSLLQFMANPHYPAPLLGMKISGATTVPAPDENAEAKKLITSGAAPPYKPPILGYRFAGMRFSSDGRRAVVISNLTVAATQFLGPTSTVMPLYEFWIKDADGVWYADLEATTLIHTSGAATGRDPMEGLAEKVEPARLAGALVAEARAAADEDQAAGLLEQALWLDVPEAVRLMEERHMGRREMLRGHLDRVYAGMWRAPGFYPALMEAAPWYLLIGENNAAYDCYRIATTIDVDSAPARAGAALAAARAGRWSDASAHYRHMLRIGAAGDAVPPSLEEYLAPECRLCGQVPAAEGLEIAARLCNRGDYATAAPVYRFYAERHPGFAEGLARLKRGEEVRLSRLLGDGLAQEAAALTYHDAAGLLGVLGLRVTHPDDIPAGGALPPGGVELRSSLPLPQTDFSKGLYTYVIPAEGYIRGKNADFRQQLFQGGGWLLAFVDAGKLSGMFHPDDAAGQNPSFVAAMGKMKKGTTVFVVRAGSVPLVPDAAALKALASVGVDPAGLSRPVKDLALSGIKGGTRGSARVFASDAGLYRVLDKAANGGPGAVRLSGFGPSTRVRLAR